MSKIYSPKQLLSSIIMLMALAWLTVSTPFVYAAQKMAQQNERQNSKETKDDSNPFSNTTEEKNESAVNTLSEYLHEMHVINHPVGEVVQHNKCNPFDLYIAYHPELLSPPPEA